MAEEERKTKAERRAEARAERRRKEEEAARQKKRQSARNAVITVAVIAIIALISVPALMSWFGGDAEASRTIGSPEEVLAQRDAAGCEMIVDGQPVGEPTHVDPAEAPPADVMYAQSEVRPNYSGPHYGNVSNPIGGIPSSPLDERAVTHNLEHGSVVVWFDPEQVDDATVNEIENWMLDRQDLGYSNARTGGSIFASPYDDITSGKPIAFRAWGYAMDCDEWDATVADSMLIDYWGTRGSAPERSLSPYPDGGLDYGSTEDATDEPTEGGTEQPTDGE